MERHLDPDAREVLPPCAVEYIGQVTRKMRYRRGARAEVGAELTAHFTEALQACADAKQRQTRARELMEQFGDAKLLAVLCRRAKKRCRPLWRKILIRSAQAFAAVFLYMLLCSIVMSLGKPVIRVNYVEWLNERWRPEAGDMQNARTHYRKAAQSYIESPPQLKGKRGGRDRLSAGWFFDYNDVEIRIVEEWLADNAPAFELLRQGADAPCYWPVYDIENSDLGDPNFLPDAMDTLAGYRKVVLAFRAQIACEAYRGQLEKALNDCLAIRAFGRQMQGKGLLNEQLVGIAVENIGYQSLFAILQRSEVAPAVLERVQKRIRSLVDQDRTVITLDGERVFWYDLIQRTFTDDGQGGGRALPKGMPYAAGDWRDNLLGLLVFNYPDRHETEAMVEQYFDRVRRELAEPPYERTSGHDTSDTTIRPAPNALLALVEPVHARVGQMAWRTKTYEVAALVTLAVERYARERGGYPERLDQLVQDGYLETIPNDPFGEGPLTYRKTSAGFLLYSWGQNLTDEGGEPSVGEDGQPHLWTDNGDWVFWPVAQGSH